MPMTLTDFLGAFFPDADEPIHLRAFKAKNEADGPHNRPRNWPYKNQPPLTRQRLAHDKRLQRELSEANQTRGLYFVVNSGGGNDKAINRFNAFFAEDDERPMAEQHTRLDACPLPPSIRVETRKSVHAYWLISGACAEAEWRDIQARLIAYFQCDAKIKNPARVMRLPFFNHISWNESAGYDYKRVTIPHFVPETRYTFAQMSEAFPPVEPDPKPPKNETHHFTSHEARHAELIRRVEAQGRRNERDNIDAPGVCHNGKGKTGLALFANGAVKCNSGCDYFSILRAFGLPDGHLPKNGNTTKQSQKPASEDPPALRVVRMADVASETVDWLWFPYIPLGKLTLLEGDGGLGKSWLTCALATAVSCGSELPKAVPSAPANVLMLSAEDGLGDTLRPRLDAFGADVTRVYAIDEPLTLDAGGLLGLEAAIIENEARLVIIDPLFAYTGGKVDIHRANEARGITAPLSDIAAKHGCAVVAVRHLNKSRGAGHAANAGIGSIDFYAAARSVLMVGADPDDKAQRALVQTKNNLAPFGPAIGFKIEDGCFWWTGESTLTAGRILSISGDEEQRSAQDEAVDFLRSALAEGERQISDVTHEGRAAGITDKPFRRARERLGIKTRREGKAGNQKSDWSLPSDAPATSSHAQETQVGHDLEITEDKASYDKNLTSHAQVSWFGQDLADAGHDLGRQDWGEV